MMQLGHIIKVT